MSDSAVSPGTNARSPAGQLTGERRQVTALFYDIVGSTELLHSLDPEDFGVTQRALHNAAVAIVRRYGGQVERLHGDGGVAYYGLPVPMEDAAECAVASALEIVDFCRRSDGDAALRVRVGVATGVVIVTDPESASLPGQGEIIGIAPAMASRIQSEAEPNSVVVADATYQLTRSAFEYQPVGSRRLKGFSEPVGLWRPSGRRHHVDRFSARRGTAPLVGRESDLGTCRDAWSHLGEGGGVVFIHGEAGIGKSRLVAELRRELAGADCDIRVLQCQPRGNTRPLHPLLDHLRQAAEEPTTTAEKPRLGPYFERYGLGGADADVIGFLLGGGGAEGGGPWLAELAAEDVKRHAVDSVMRLLAAWSRQRPQLVIIEDLHWADTLTRALLAQIPAAVASLPVLVLVTSREEIPPEIAGQPNVHVAALSRLDVAATAVLLRSAWGIDPPAGLAQFIHDRSDGVPLFAEELAHLLKEEFGGRDSVIADWSKRLNDGHVLTLEDLVAARLATLGDARRTAQTASVIGREFRIDLLSRVSGQSGPEASLASSLEELVRAGILAVSDAGAPSYRFRHVLIQEAAYNSLLKAERLALHRRIVDLITSGTVSEPPDEIAAWHCQQAGRPVPAANYALRAAEACLARSAIQEADKLLGLAEEQLGLADNAAAGVDGLRLRLLAVRGPVASELYGRGAQQTRAIYEQAIELCRQGGDRDRTASFPLYWGWWFTAPDYEAQKARSEVLVRDHEASTDPEVRLQSLHCAWSTNFDAGEHAYCLDCVRKGLELYDEARARQNRGRYGSHDAKVCGLGERALSLWFTGDEGGSAESLQAAMDWAERLDHFGSRFHALDYALVLRAFQKDYSGVVALAERMASIATDNRLPRGTAKAKLFRGWGRALTGELPSGLAEFEEGFAMQQEIGTPEHLSIYSDMRAEILGLAGRAEEALELVEPTIETVTRAGQVFWVPELYRRRGHLYHAVGRPAGAVAASFEKALGLAAEQGAAALRDRALRDLETLGRVPAQNGA